jgi:hypothetical protein
MAYFSEITHFAFSQLAVKLVLLLIIGQTNEEIIASSSESEYIEQE